MNLISFAIATLVLHGGAPPPPQMAKLLSSRTLPVGTKPTLMPAPLKGKPLVSGGEYQIEKEPLRRVFRFSFKGDVVSFGDQAMKGLKGWTKIAMMDDKGKPQPSQGATITGPRLAGTVSRQILIVLPGQYLVDAKSRFGSKKVMTKGWISVSYNEEYAAKPK